MLTFEDCVGLCELSEAEVEAIAEHEHLTEMVALEMGNYLTHTPAGERRIRAMIIDDIRIAEEAGRLAHVAMLKSVLKEFVAHHGRLSHA